jgi:hypothetical protein
VVSAWSWFRIYFWGAVNGGEVVHGRGFESLILGVNGGESPVSAWSRVRILDCSVVNCGVITIRESSKANQAPRKPSRSPGLYYIISEQYIFCCPDSLISQFVVVLLLHLKNCMP